MAGKMSEEQKAKLKAGREAAKKAREEAAANGGTPAAAASAVKTIKINRKVGAVIGRLQIPKGTPADALSATVTELLAEARKQGLTPTKVGGVIKLF